MSISFSGLTSGLDTSSWIESLVSLKQAKVTTLQTQREEIVASKNTLNSIKSFFTAFRSTLQKITAGKFGNTANAMDIFSRNIAVSSNPNIITAIVNETAQEGSYQIKVDQLATKTTVTSGDRRTSSTTGVNLSVANYADMNTTMEVIGITEGILKFNKDGTTINLNIERTDTLNDLNNKLGDDITLSINDGKIEISSNEGPIYYISIPSSSNFESVVGLSNTEDGKIVGTSNLYRVNRNTALMTAGVFRYDDITAGTFKVGDSEITIDGETTISDVIDQINNSEVSNATAHWDDHNAKLIIESRITGNYALSIQDNTSNFAKVFGFVGENNILFTEYQVLGKNSIFSINGEQDSAFTNELDSTITGITGVTINLKNVSSNGEYTTITIEKDKETLANAVSSLVDSYNTLVENIDEELARDNSLVSLSGLKFLKNQIRSLMTSSFLNDGNYQKLSTIGISTKAASPGDINTAGINKLSFDKNKFIEAFSSDPDSVRKLMLGTDTNKGIIWQIEDIVDTAVSSVSGYFSTTNNTFNKQISRIDNRIKKASSGVDIYRERLERKFNAMELLITKMQDQYGSFLNTGAMM